MGADRCHGSHLDTEPRNLANLEPEALQVVDKPTSGEQAMVGGRASSGGWASKQWWVGEQAVAGRRWREELLAAAPLLTRRRAKHVVYVCGEAIGLSQGACDCSKNSRRVHV